MRMSFCAVSLFLLVLAGLITPVLGQDAPDTDSVNDLLSAGSQAVTMGDVLMNEAFNDDLNWPEWDDNETAAVLEKGVYHMTVEGDFYSWQLSAEDYTDVVIQVEAQQASKTVNNEYGVMCRASSDGGTGYYFLITGDGYYAILKLTDPDGGRQEVVEWDTSEYVQGQDGSIITAVCVDDYLALYANGHLLAEANDSEFTDGAVGLTVGGYDDNAVTDVGFDNLVLWDAAAEKSADTPKDDSQKQDDRVQQANLDLADLLSAGSQAVSLGDVAMNETFDDDENWPVFDEGDGFTGELVDGTYHLKVEGNFYSWQASKDSYKDVVIQVETEQVSKNTYNNYGLSCRSSGSTGTGYYFLISGDGYYAILKLTDPDEGRQELVEWETSEYINQGQESNTITAVCVGNYLALYANGYLLAETTDDEFPRGLVSLTLGNHDDNAVSEIAFDNLLIQQAAVE